MAIPFTINDAKLTAVSASAEDTLHRTPAGELAVRARSRSWPVLPRTKVTRILSVSAYARVISGMNVLNAQGQNALGKTRWELGYTALSDTWDEHRALCEAHEPFREFEFQVTGKDGLPYHIRVSGKPIFNENGELTGYRGVGQDITESKRALVALQESETRYRQAAEIAHLGYWVWDDIEDKLTDVSQLAAKVHGFSVDEFLAHSSNRSKDNDLVHPDDRAAYETGLRESERNRSNYELELRANTPDGRIRYVRELANRLSTSRAESFAPSARFRNLTSPGLALNSGLWCNLRARASPGPTVTPPDDRKR